MKYCFENASVYEAGRFTNKAFCFEVGSDSGESVFSHKYVVFPGFCDVHVHFREPGFSYKETIKTGSMAAAHGGFTDVCCMPNLNPIPDSVEHLQQELEIINRDACIGVHPYGAITVGELGKQLADMDGMAPNVCAFSADGRGVQADEMMHAGMEKAKELGKIVAAHCEVNELLRGGYIHDGVYAKEHGHKGICSESEWAQIARDIELVREIGVKYHVCHISSKESVAVIRKAKSEGVNITCETGPHYLIMCDEDLQEDGRFKMNPPLRSREDREALLEGIKDGTIDCIATDHAPHSAEEKSRGLQKSAMGVVGLETSFPALYTHLVKTGIITLEKLVDLMCNNPRKRFDLPVGNSFCIWDLDTCAKVDPETFLTKGRATPFAGMELYGKCVMTVHNGNIVYQDKEALK